MTHAGGGLFHAGARPDEGGTWTEVQVHLRVIPRHHGDEPFEVNLSTRIHSLKHKGDTVPVWYDPNNHSRVVVDYEADLEKEGHPDQHEAADQHQGPEIIFVSTFMEALHAALVRHPAKGFAPPA